MFGVTPEEAYRLEIGALRKLQRDYGNGMPS